MSCHPVNEIRLFSGLRRFNTIAVIAAPKEVPVASKAPRNTFGFSAKNACAEMKTIPVIPKIKVIIFSNVIFSLRNIAANKIIISGCVFPRTEAIPAPVNSGLENINPKVIVVDIIATGKIHLIRLVRGKSGFFRIKSNKISEKPPRKVLNPAKRRGGEYSNPILIAV